MRLGSPPTSGRWGVDFAFANDLVSFRALVRIDGALMQATAAQLYVGGAS